MSGIVVIIYFTKTGDSSVCNINNSSGDVLKNLEDFSPFQAFSSVVGAQRGKQRAKNKKRGKGREEAA